VSTIEVAVGDITKLEVDAIVNAANASLTEGGGVCGAIHFAAGPELAKECATIGYCPTGEARLTQGYRLPARYVIHAVGPVWQDGAENEPELLARCYRNSLALAAANDIHSIAFPAISTGIFGYPKSPACAIAVAETRRFIEHNNLISKIIFCCFDDDSGALYRAALAGK
jgi:O-acetyl-ADP-ribose deacetylase